MVLRFNESVGTGGDDSFGGTTGSISFGLQGDDSFFAATGNDFTVFAGGSGSDTYFINVVDTAITILDSGGNSDLVVANGIGFGFAETFAATIDNRHLLVFDTFSGQQILILDWQDPAHRIEFVQLADGLFSYDFIVANIFSAPNFLGDLTWAEAGILGDFTEREMNEAIAFYSVVESTLESFGFPLIDGTSGNDTMFGTTLLDDVIRGGAGDDIIFGGAGHNLIEGGTGADIIDGGAGFDAASYQDSDAAVFIDLSTGTFDGGDATGDQLTNIEDIIGSDFSDTLIGDAGGNYIFGGLGNDLLEGGADGDFLDGQEGKDTASYAGSAAAVTIDLGAGTTSGGDATGDVLTSIENLVGSAFVDFLTGDSGANVLEGGGGADALDGGGGSDTASYAGSAAGVTVNLDSGSVSGGDAAGDTFTSIENLTGSSFDDTLTGSGGGNRIDGGAGNDTLFGLGGNDRLIGLGGNDTIDGGAGNDRLIGNAGNDILSGGDGDDQLQGNRDDDVLDGGAGNDIVLGNAGNDTVLGGAGNDNVQGNKGDDIVEGGAGADTVNGGGGIDIASYASSNAAVVVRLDLGTASGGDADGDVLSNIEGLRGSAFNDLLVGDAGDNVLEGLAGNDRLTGLAGDDTINGGTGNDRIIGNAGDDVIMGGGGKDTLQGNRGNDHIDGGNGDDLILGNSFNDVLIGGAGNDKIFGNRDNDTLFGNAGMDVLLGGSGIDRLDGGADDDTLTGGSGADTFVFSGTWGDDVITDFEDGSDLLDFSGSGLGFGDLTISQAASDTLIEDAFGNSITLQGITTSDITVDDFLF